MLLPLLESTFKPKIILRAASVSVADAPDGDSNCLRPTASATRLTGSGTGAGGSKRLGPIAWATCIARSQLVRISISAPITLSESLLDWNVGFVPSIGSTALLSRT